MAEYTTNIQNYEDIADAIREKNGESTLYLPSEMAEAIRNIPLGLILIEERLSLNDTIEEE